MTVPDLQASGDGAAPRVQASPSASADRSGPEPAEGRAAGRWSRTAGGVRQALRLAATIGRVEAIQAALTIARPVRALGRWRTATPERLLIAPQDIRTADATVAGDIYAGHLVFGGGFVDSHGRSPFELEPPSESWAEDLHGFGWLRHLRAANTGLSRANARALVEDWMTHNDAQPSALAWRPPVVARRLLSWLAQSPIILAPPDGAFYRRFTRSIGRQVVFLQNRLAGGLKGEARLIAALALAEAGLCAEGLATARRQGTRLLAEELDRQILPDGGHVSRNPAVLVELLLDLLPLRQSYAARGAPMPPALINAVDRIIPMIRMFRHGDGTLALMNGMGVTEPDMLATVLTYDDIRARPLLNAPHSGYQRLEAEGTLLICDTGKPPPRGFGERAHAGTLAFEMSVGLQRVIINCGRPGGRRSDAIQASRSTAAHSTLVIGDASSSRFATPALRRWFGSEIVAGPRSVSVARADESGSQVLTVSHDGYASRFGLLHRRRLLLDRGGGLVRGEDSLVPADHGAAPSPQNFVIRFHLHPAVRLQRVQGGTAVLLTLPQDERWLFEADQAVAAVEESILFAASHGPRQTSQIAVEALYPDVSIVPWSLARLAPGRS